MARPRARTVLRLAAVLLLAAVAGCGGGEEPDEAVRGGAITVWTLETEPARVAATRDIAARFTRRGGTRVEIVPVDENRLPALVRRAAARRALPDVLWLPLGLVHAYAQQSILHPTAAQAVVDELGPSTFAEAALKLVNRDGRAAAVPSDGWGQLLIYRRDLFDRVGLPTPQTLEDVRAAAAALDRPGRAGIVLGTAPGDAFTEQSFEHVALANGCELVDAGGNPSLTSELCVDAFRRYAQLAREHSVAGVQDAETTRDAYFAGRAAMVMWSPFLLDAMAGLRDDAVPSCPQCREDPAFLARNSGVVTALGGASGRPAQYGELGAWGITARADVARARAWVTYMLSDGYVRWLGISPQGKFPARPGDAEQPRRFVEAWSELDSGVERKAPLRRFYDADAIQALASGAERFQRWGFEQGQGAIVGAMAATRPISAALARAIAGARPAAAAAQAQDALEEINATL